MPKKSKIVSAVGASANTLAPGGRPLAQRIEQAMSDAVTRAMGEGVTDPAEIKAQMMAARAEVLGDEPS